MSISKFVCFLAALICVSTAVALWSVNAIRPAGSVVGACPPFLVVGFGCMPAIDDVYAL